MATRSPIKLLLSDTYETRTNPESAQHVNIWRPIPTGIGPVLRLVTGCADSVSTVHNGPSSTFSEPLAALADLE